MSILGNYQIWRGRSSSPTTIKSVGFWLGMLLGLTAVAANGCAATLPVFMADNHAETFGWITRTFDLDSQVTLVLVDAHSDSTAVERSDQLREEVRRVFSNEERAKRVEGWRTDGRIQAFNWIEPLMPRPLDRVIWLAKPEMLADQRAEAAWDAVQGLDGRFGTEPRDTGTFASRWEVVDAAGLKAWHPELTPVVLSIDLDFFTGMPDAPRRFEEIWETAMDWPGLAGVSIAISRPWLKDTAEANFLVRLVVGTVARTRGAALEWDVSMDDRPDGSLKAGEIGEAGGVVPRWDMDRAEPWLRAILAMRNERWCLAGRRRERSDNGADGRLLGWVAVDGEAPGCDGVVRLAAPVAAVLRLRPGDGAEASGRVRWFARVPVRVAYDLLPETGLGKSFSRLPARWIYERRISLGETTDFALRAEAWMELLDKQWDCGRVVVEAEYEAGDHWLPAVAADVRVRVGEGFHAALSECFGMPYVFGVALQDECGMHGVDTGWGSDCSNFLAYAWRRIGVRAPWGDPGMLRRGLSTVARMASPDSGVKLDAAMLRCGVEVDFGNHVGALWEDREPLGVLDGGDMIAHHLGGLPEVLSLEELARVRGEFAVRTAAAPRSCRIGFAGDVVLAGDMTGMEKLAVGLQASDLALANLEGIPSERGPDVPVRHDFRFPVDRLGALRKAGVRVVSLANNHATDAGNAGLIEGIAAVRAAGIGVVGAGRNLAEASRPWRGKVNGQSVAVFGVCAVDAQSAGLARPGVLRLPDHAAELARQISAVLADGEWPVVLVHWGDEHAPRPNEDQQHWALWLTEHGVIVVAGSGPHVVQEVEFHAGGVVAHSLGNAAYPRDLLGLGGGMVWTVTLDARGSVVETACSPAGTGGR